MRSLTLFLLLAVSAWGQNHPQPLQVTRYLGIHTTSILDCGGGPNIDNRSGSIRQNDQHSFYATGTGTWSVSLQYSDTSCSGPWTTFGSSATVDQSSTSGIGFGAGYHPFIHFAISGANAGTVLINYSGWKQFYATSSAGGGGGGGVTFPIGVNQGGTGASDGPTALSNLGLSFPIPVTQGGTGSADKINAKKHLGFSQVIATDYTFSQAPGGSLIAGGVGQSITLTPCPVGVNGSDTNHYIYLKDGTGTPEATLITGGTCTSAATTGTITVTPANAHSGAWTVNSASGGIQEAHNDAAWGGSVLIPVGTYKVYAPIYVSKTVTFEGDSQSGSVLQGQAASQGIIHQGIGAYFYNLQINSLTPQSAGGYGIMLDSTAGSNSFSFYSHMQFTDLWDAILSIDAGRFTVTDSWFTNFGSTGVTAGSTSFPDNGGPTITNCNFSVFSLPTPPANAALKVTSTGDITFSNNGVNGSGNLLNFAINNTSTVSSGLLVVNNDFESLANATIRMSGTYILVNINDNHFAQFGGPNTWQGIIFDDGVGTTGIKQFTITGNVFYGNGVTSNEAGVEFVGHTSDGYIGSNHFNNMGSPITLIGNNAQDVTIGINQMSNSGGTSGNINAGTGVTVLLGAPVPFSGLQSWKNGSYVYCTDCNTTCSGGSSTGQYCKRLNGAWVGDTGGGGGGNLTSINSDSTAAQTLSTGTAGSNFSIVDAGSGSHVFNLPVASGTNTGKLSNSDWTTFNNKIDPGGSYSNPSWITALAASKITGILGVGFGGTGQGSITNHALVVGAGASPLNIVGPGSADNVLMGQGAGSDPSFFPVANCPSDGVHAEVYSTSTHSWSCANLTTGTANPGQLHISTISGVPTMACTSSGAGSVETFVQTLTGNVTGSYSVTGCTTGQDVRLVLCENATGGFSYTPPTNLKGFPGLLNTTAHYCQAQNGYYDGTNINLVGVARIYKDDFTSILSNLILSDGAGGTSTVSPQTGTFTYSLPTASGTLVTSAQIKYQTVLSGATTMTQRSKLKLIAGSNITLTPVDNSGSDQSEITIAASGGGGSLTGAQWNPFGFQMYGITSNTGLPAAANRVYCWEMPPTLNYVVNKLLAPAVSTYNNVAWAFYDSSGTKIQQSDTQNTTATFITWNFSSPATLSGQTFVCAGTDSASLNFYGVSEQYAGAANFGKSSTTYSVFVAANASSTSVGVTTMPATLGTRTDMDSLLSNPIGSSTMAHPALTLR